jgi:Fe-S-cluster-containing hydrogenase component 2
MKYEIRTYPTRCVGCYNCQLICSFLYEKTFSTAKARIMIDHYDSGSMIGFTDQCIRCGTCVDYCLYDALEKVEGGE